MNNIWKDLGLEVGKIIADEIKGGPTSGNYGHGGRPGEGKIIEINQNPASPNAIY